MTLEQKQTAAIEKATALATSLNAAIDSGLWNSKQEFTISDEPMTPRWKYSVHSHFAGIIKFIPDENGIEKAEVDEDGIIKQINQ